MFWISYSAAKKEKRSKKSRAKAADICVLTCHRSRIFQDSTACVKVAKELVCTSVLASGLEYQLNLAAASVILKCGQWHLSVF